MYKTLFSLKNTKQNIYNIQNARQMIHMKYLVLLSLKNKHKVLDIDRKVLNFSFAVSLLMGTHNIYFYREIRNYCVDASLSWSYVVVCNSFVWCFMA